MKNCFIISIVYKYRNRKSKLKIKSPRIFSLYSIFYKPLFVIRYLKFYKQQTGNLYTLFYPHFYIEDCGYFLDFWESNGKIIVNKTKILSTEQKIERNSIITEYLKTIDKI